MMRMFFAVIDWTDIELEPTHVASPCGVETSAAFLWYGPAGRCSFHLRERTSMAVQVRLAVVRC